MTECRHTWGDRRQPTSRRGVGHDDGKPVHRCVLVPGHASNTHRCSCGAASVL